MASTDAKVFPVKNQAYRLTFPAYFTTLLLLTSGTAADTELSKDGGTFADATNEVTEIATNSGVYFIDLTAAEMNFDTVVVKTTFTNLTAAPTVTVLYPQSTGDIPVAVEDKTGFSLSAAGIQAIWDALTSALTTSGSVGKRIADDLDVVVSTRLATSGYTTPPTVVQNRQEMDSNSTKLANLDAAISTRSTVTVAQVKTQAVDALATDTYVESNAVPGATATLATKISWLAALARNKITQTATTQSLRNDADSGNIGTAETNDDGTTFTRSEWS